MPRVRARVASNANEGDAVKWPHVRQLLVLLSLVGSAVILWIDIATGLWQEYVILAGLAAGLVTFGLTSLIIDRVIARAAHQRWKPVTRLALTDILHAIADEQRSEVAHGVVTPVTFDPVAAATSDTLARLRHDVLTERTRLARALAHWSTFLASSADATAVLDHAADLAEALDGIRDLSLEAKRDGGAGLVALNAEITRYNDAVHRLVHELGRAVTRAARQD